MNFHLYTTHNYTKYAELKDPRVVNASFTSSNLREELVCCRLDRFSFSNGCEDFFPPSFRKEALARVASHH